MSAVARFKVGKKEFVVLPARRYEQLTRAEQDQKDAEIARKADEAYRAGKLKTITHEQLRRKLGL
jgi:PHD/YefM family antitoxin component YafN of YafNO toxin-antitoxin module